ncbi:uncharacterized protein PV09_05964 [Verruconis gallopava]|uniref:Aldose 1-epimerase n=1 Tax=Verruconis gallopava TaxID=253628 RepID=A0A0D2A837_9PEZI|nr:uncharacterized protein PV09_05964 [Verruconis gallopava]KIW02918.1 hypothetical protein PV09_05964 [Verruconis gallopava]
MPSKAQPEIEFLQLGAILQKFELDGLNIVQGFPTAELYQQHNDPYFGETIGRVANRISGAKINRLNGRSYPLAANNGPNSLHGGLLGWGKRLFNGPTSVERNGKQAVHFGYISPDGEEGFPGTVQVNVFYTTSVQEQDGRQITVLEMEYEAELVGDEDVEETVVAMTNHSYFNLSGSSTIEGTEVTLSCDLHQVVDSTSIPTGVIQPYPGIKAHEKFTLGAEEPDVDHCFIMNADASSIPIDTREQPFNQLGSFYHPVSRVHLEIHSTEPAFQFYTGRYIDVPAVGGLPARGRRSGFCIEPSRYVNAVNEEKWRNMVVLKRGQKYGSRTMYRAWRD